MAGFENINVDAILTALRRATREAQNEEELRISVSRIIEDQILKPLGIDQIGRYEYTLISGARADALYGHVVIEYKAPGKLSNKNEVAKAKEQIIRYIINEANGVEERFRHYYGVIISDRIAFVSYVPNRKEWILMGPYDITREAVIKLIEVLRGLQRRPLNVENLMRDFGPKSEVAIRTIRLLYERIKNSNSERVRLLFQDWLRLFSQATGYSPDKLRELREMVKSFGFSEGTGVDYNVLLFSIHTYYALIMKLLAAEIAYLYGQGKYFRSYVAELENSYTNSGAEGLKSILADLEDGGLFAKLLNIVNFVEGDYFSWYLDVLDKELGDAIANIARRLALYEPASPQLVPHETKDLLKRLYQALLPRDVRHKLGEYYTPDWLAELILNEVGLTRERFEEIGAENPLRPLEIRVLDPACGSGTFLLAYIKRIREYAEEHFLTDQLVSYLIRNVVGYDLNPLAVLASRTNYLLVIGDLLGYAKGSIEIPVYLADSVVVETSSTLRGKKYILKTVVGTFQIPATVVERELLNDLLSDIRQSIRRGDTKSEFAALIKTKYSLEKEDAELIADLYETFLKLEKEGKNHVWISIIRNAFAPILKGRFDYVVGNPPWINWENLPETYREVSRPLWERYNLTRVKGMGLGKVKRDMAMLFLVRSIDLYLKDCGTIGFLVPFTLFKTQAGAGFREKISSWQIRVIHDLVTLYPFEGAVNRTAAIVVAKEEHKGPHVYRHIIWLNRNRKAVPTDSSLEDVLRITERLECVMIPVRENDPSEPWLQTTESVWKALKKVVGKSQYKAFAGVNTGLNQVYYVDVLEKTPDGLLVIENPERGGEKKTVKTVIAKVDPDHVYPLIRGRDIKKWYVKYDNRYILLPHNSRTGKPIAESELKINWPKTYDYFKQFEEELRNRSIHKLWGRNNPFYSVYDIGGYTFSPYKVVWKNIAGAIIGKAASFQAAVVEPYTDKLLGKKIVIPNVKLMLTPVSDRDEAYYLCAILNSTLIKYVVASYMIETNISTNLYEYIVIPTYERSNNMHKRIAELGKMAHELSAQILDEDKTYLITELKRVEEEIDRAVAALYGLSDMELAEIKRFFAILAAEEVPVEEDILSEENEPKIILPKTVLSSNQAEIITVNIINPSKQQIEVELFLPDGNVKTISTNEMEHFLDVPVNPLPPGIYQLKYTIKVDGQTLKEDSVEIAVTQPRRFRSR